MKLWRLRARYAVRPLLLALCVGGVVSAAAAAPLGAEKGGARAQAPAPSDPGAGLTFSAREYRANLSNQSTQITGDVRVQLGDQLLLANEAQLNTSTGQVSAKGDVRFTHGKLTVTGAWAEFNMNTGLGAFYDATLSIEDGPHIEGRVLRRYDTDRYQIENGKLSPCQGCPRAWSVTGSFMDVRIEGYAEVQNALFQVRDTPILYFPIFYYPVKTKRQSGLLIPQFEQSSVLGSQLLFPYYWALSPHSDTTFEYRHMTRAGERLGNEFRYRRSDRTFAYGLSSVAANRVCEPGGGSDCRPFVGDRRFGASYQQRWQISPQWVERLNGEYASDPRYTRDFPKDFVGNEQPSLVNEASLTWQNGNNFFYGLAQFNRDNIPRDVDPAGTTTDTFKRAPAIHLLPELGYERTSQSLWRKLRWETSVQGRSMRRFLHATTNEFLTSTPVSAGVDADTGWIRTGDRATVRTRMHWPVTFWRYFDWEPTLELRTDLYHFSAPGVAPSAARGRLYLDQTFSTDVWRVYSSHWGDLRAVKHTVTPTVRWSYSPNEILSHDPDNPSRVHPFFTQTHAPRFDIFDPASDAGRVQLGTLTEEQRLGPHHRLALGAETRVVGRFGDASRSYEEFLNAGIAQDIDLWERTLNRLEIHATAAFRGLSLTTEARIAVQDEYGADNVTGLRVQTGKKGDANVRSDLAYSWSRYGVGTFYKVQPDERKVGLSGSISAWGPITARAGITYDPLAGGEGRGWVHEKNFYLSYLSPSKCWNLSFELSQTSGQRIAYAPRIGLSFSEGAKGTFF